MCGIFGILGQTTYSRAELSHASEQAINRGPEHSTLLNISDSNVTLGFHRLAINGINDLSNQPLCLNGTYLICNGEIYNYKSIYKECGFIPKTNSDCEVILHLYEKYGMDGVLQMIDGVFAFILIDTKLGIGFVARDTYGVRPLFMSKTERGFYGFASEMKQLIPITNDTDVISQFNPGTVSVFSLREKPEHMYSSTFATVPFLKHPDNIDIQEHMTQVSIRLRAAVAKRVTATDRPIACLLSGGLDSSLITALVSEHFEDKSMLETYSIGLQGSDDLRNALYVAKHIGSSHTSIIVTEKDMLDAIPLAIKVIESYDTTTVRACVVNLLLAKYIKEHSQAKVIFNGDGSDELTGGYLYFHECPSSVEFDLECKRLLKNIHFFDGLRSDRCIAYYGLEPRTPFLDRSFTEYYLSIPTTLRNHNICNKSEKYILRDCFKNDNLLPEEVRCRTKEAFSDGVSSQTKSWFEIIQDNIPTLFHQPDNHTDYHINPPKTPEQRYYRHMFEEDYKGRGGIIPYFWMPKFTDATDCSARSLKIYNTFVKT